MESYTVISNKFSSCELELIRSFGVLMITIFYATVPFFVVAGTCTTSTPLARAIGVCYAA